MKEINELIAILKKYDIQEVVMDNHSHYGSLIRAELNTDNFSNGIIVSNDKLPTDFKKEKVIQYSGIKFILQG